MKDKRQKLAMSWPYDPNLYAYLMNAAAVSLTQYPYAGLPNSTSPPLNYYASLGLQRAAAAYSPFLLMDPLRPPSETMTNLPNPIYRPFVLDPLKVQPNPGFYALTRDHRASPERRVTSERQPGSCIHSPEEPCNCRTIAASPQLVMTTTKPSVLRVTSSKNGHAMPPLFQPYKGEPGRV